MTFRGLKIKWTLFKVNTLYAGTKEKNFEKKRKLLNAIGYSIGEGSKIVGPVFCSGKLIVGNNTWIGRNLVIHGNGTVKIGDNCDLAPDVVFLTGGHEIGSAERRAGEGYIKDIEVGNGCWLGARSTVLGGVQIEDGSVVAACACVVKTVSANTLVGGVPAKEIRKLSDDEKIF